MSYGTSKSAALESEISDWLVDLIKNDELHDSIAGKDETLKLAEITTQPDFIPSFTIDYISRMAWARAAKHVLGQLEALEIIAVNKSISLKTGEILRPDIVAFNPETRAVVIFEIKRDVMTERQAITELMAYEHEIQNNFPFLSNYELCFVIVAQDWNTLMDHAVSSIVTWSNKQCLALKLELGPKDKKISCYMPSAWSLLGSFGVPPSALQTVDLVLYESEEEEAEDGEDEVPPRLLLTAAQLIARNGDAANSHGFLMIWRDHGGFPNVRWVMTICVFDPMVFFFEYRNPDNLLALRESELTEFIEARAVDLISGFLPSSAFGISRSAIDLLNTEYQADLENFSTWHDKLLQHKTRAYPIYFEFWGKPGEYVRQLVAHSAVRERYMPHIQASALDWTDAVVAYPFVEQITGRWPFPGGLIRCTDAYELGEVLQLLAMLYGNAHLIPEIDAPWHAFTRWVELRAVCFMIEAVQIYYSSETLNVAPPALSNRPDKREKATEKVTEWARAELIGDEHKIHQLCFDIGAFCAVFSDERLALLAESEQANKVREASERGIRRLLRYIFAYYQKLDDEGSAADEQAQLFLKIVSALPGIDAIDLEDGDALEDALLSIPGGVLREIVSTVILPVADLFFGDVYHKAADTALVNIDWDWIKAGVQQMFEGGERRPAVTRDQAGNIGTAALRGPYHGLLAEISNPDAEVYFLDEMAGVSFAVKMTWAKLIDDVFGKPKAFEFKG